MPVEEEINVELINVSREEEKNREFNTSLIIIQSGRNEKNDQVNQFTRP